MYVFFVQLDQDIDHIVPIVWRLVRERPGCARIVSTHPGWTIDQDYRLRLLRREYGVPVHVVHRAHSGIFLRARMFSAVLRLPRWILARVSVRWWTAAYFRLSGRILEADWLERFLRSCDATAVIVDEAQPRANLQAIWAATRRLRIPVVNVPTSSVMLKPEGDGTVDDSLFDYAVVSRLPVNATPSAKAHVLGCMRYCSEWHARHIRLLQDNFPMEDPLFDVQGHLKILIFGRGTIGLGEDHPLVDRLRSIPGVKVIFKGKPRTVLPRKLYESGVNRFPSARLIQWADVVVCSISSIVLEVLLQGKPLLYAKFLAPDETSVFEEYGACWQLESEEQLFEAVQKLRADPGFRPYAEQDVDRLLDDAVYARNQDRDVLGRCVQFLQQVVDGPTPVAAVPYECGNLGPSGSIS